LRYCRRELLASSLEAEANLAYTLSDITRVPDGLFSTIAGLASVERGRIRLSEEADFPFFRGPHRNPTFTAAQSWSNLSIRAMSIKIKPNHEETQ
jgi:hypothetical protein